MPAAGPLAVRLLERMRTAIIGLPMAGKTSLFTILTGAHEATRVGSMEAKLGITRVPDERVDAVAGVFDPSKVTHATMEYVDFPSISKEVLRDPKYLGSLRVVDALAHVLRVFESDIIPHEKGSVDPVRDLDDMETELILSDLIVIEQPPTSGEMWKVVSSRLEEAARSRHD